MASPWTLKGRGFIFSPYKVMSRASLLSVLIVESMALAKSILHPDVCGNDVRNEFIKSLVAEAVKHLPAFFPLGADVPSGKV